MTPYVAGSDVWPGLLATHRALDAVQAPIMLLTKSYDVTFGNAAAVHTFGCETGHFVGRPLRDFVDKAINGQQTKGTRANGDRFPANIVVTELGTDGEAGLIAVLSDLSDDQRAEDRLRMFIRAAPTAMVLFKPSGAISLSNSGAEIMFGYAADELVAMSFDELVPDNARPHHNVLLDDFTDNPGRSHLNSNSRLRGLARDGTEIPVSVHLSPIHIGGNDYMLASITDLSAQRREQARAAVAEAQRLQADMLGNLPFSVMALDVEGLVMDANPAALRLLDLSAEDLLGSTFLSIHDGDDLALLAADIGRTLGRRTAVEFGLFRQLAHHNLTDARDMTYVRRDGSTVAVSEVITAMRDETGRLHGYLAVAHDISRQREAESHLARMATHDELTGLPNRSTFVDRVDALISSAAFDSLAVVVFDLDNFDRVNAALGRRGGDEALIAVAHRLRILAPVEHLVARVGGDRFAFVLTGDPPRCLNDQIVASVVDGLLGLVTVTAHEVKLGASIGGALFPRDAADGAGLIKSADAALISAKSDGRGATRWFDAAARHETTRELKLQAALPAAIENGDLSMHYQPIISLASGTIVGVEALARWTSAEFGSVPPSQFIPIAEEDGSILRLGEWSLRKACADVAELNRSLGRDLKLAVNVSPRQFRQIAWADVVADSLLSSGLAPHLLELEITENIFIAHAHEAIEAIESIESQGVSVVLDDFGTGYSSFSYLTRFPLDKIKIDRAFVERLSSGPADMAVVEAIIGMAHTLGMSVVAEGVEVPSQAAFLKRHGCDEAQGFLYSPAVPPEELAALVSSLGAGVSTF